MTSSVSTVSPAQRALFQELQRLSGTHGFPLFLVGGFVRDLLLGHPLDDRDVDLLVDGDAMKFAVIVGQELEGDVRRFPSFLTAKVIGPHRHPEIAEIDLASARTEVYQAAGALPKVTRAPLEFDLRRRDFTMNAMAIPLDALLRASSRDDGVPSLVEIDREILDPFGGRADLMGGIVRVLHERSFTDDPTRLFRAARYVARISGRLDPETERLALSAVRNGALRTLSRFRVFTEYRKMCSERDPWTMFEFLDRWGIVEGAPYCDRPLLERAREDLYALRTAGEGLSWEDFLRISFLYTTPERRAALAKDLNISKKRVPHLLGHSEDAS